MNAGEIQAVIVRVLGRIAPEADFARLAPDADIRGELDLDSMDFLNFVIGLHKELGVEIPEADYHHLFTPQGAIDYLAAAGK